MSTDVPAAATSLGLGVAGGYALARTGLFLPSTVRNMFDGSGYGLLKVVLSAVGTAMVTQGVYSMMKPEEFKKSRTFASAAKSTPRVVVGGLLAGSGMALAGTAPFLLGTQIGVGVKSALTVLGGMVAGGVAYALTEKSIFPDGDDYTSKTASDAVKSLDEQFGVDYGVLAVPLGMAVYAAALALEHFFPHGRDVVLRTGQVSIPAALPVVAGTIVGAAQVPMRILTEAGVGAKNHINQLLATLGLGSNVENMRIENLGQASGLLLFGGSILGAILAQKRHPPSLLAAPGYSTNHSLLGGALIAIGGAIASNASQDGALFSGTSELAVSAIVGLVSALAGGMATTWVLRRP